MPGPLSLTRSSIGRRTGLPMRARGAAGRWRSACGRRCAAARLSRQASRALASRLITPGPARRRCPAPGAAKDRTPPRCATSLRPLPLRHRAPHRRGAPPRGGCRASTGAAVRRLSVCIWSISLAIRSTSSVISVGQRAVLLVDLARQQLRGAANAGERVLDLVRQDLGRAQRRALSPPPDVLAERFDADRCRAGSASASPG